jgi:hypothetical protein
MSCGLCGLGVTVIVWGVAIALILACTALGLLIAALAKDLWRHGP